MWWRSAYGNKRYWLGLTTYTQGNYQSDVAMYFLGILTFWILYSYLVPISLFVTMEIVKGMQVRGAPAFTGPWLCSLGLRLPLFVEQPAW